MRADQQPSRWLALAVVCAGVLMIVLDQTIVNVALPSIQTDLGFSQSALAWVVNAYLIAFGGVLLLAGRMGDLLGRRRMFLAGLAVFTAASLVCGLSTSQAMLIAARFVQGLGGATTMALVLSMIVDMFEAPGERAKALGVYGFVASSGASIGLLMGGILTQALNWHWIFFVNVPIGLAVAVLTVRLLKADQGLGLTHGADALGALLVTTSLMLGVYSIVGSPELGQTGTLGVGLGAAGLMVAFLVRQAQAANPLMPLTIFKSRSVSASNAVQALTVAAMLGMFFLSSLYLERVLAFSPLELGLSFLPVSTGISLLSLGLAPRLNVRFGPRNVLLAGLCLAFAGLILIARSPAAGRYLTDILPPMLLIGAGIGVMFPALMTLAMADVTPADSGLASGLINTSAQVGGSLGLAILATVAAVRTEALQAAGQAPAEALTAGFDLAFAICAMLFGAAIVITLVMLPSWRPAESAVEDQTAVAAA